MKEYEPMRVIHNKNTPKTEATKDYQPKPSEYKVKNYTKTPDIGITFRYNPLIQTTQRRVSLDYVSDTPKISPLKSFVNAMMDAGRNIRQAFRKFFRFRKKR